MAAKTYVETSTGNTVELDPDNPNDRVQERLDAGEIREADTGQPS